MPIDKHLAAQPGPAGPARRFFQINPSNTEELRYFTTGLWVGTGGDLAAVDPDTGKSVVFKNVPAGALLPIRTTQVRTTGTTAADIVGLS